MAGKGIHEAFGQPSTTASYYEPPKLRELRCRQFDESVDKGKEEAFRIRAALREIERRRLNREE